MKQMVSLLQILLLAQHVSGTIMLWFSSCWSGVELWVVSGLGDAAASRKPQNKAPKTTGINHLYNTLELLIMGIIVPETC